MQPNKFNPKVRSNGSHQVVMSRPLESRLPDTQIQIMAMFLKSVAGSCPCKRCEGYRDLIEGIEL